MLTNNETFYSTFLSAVEDLFNLSAVEDLFNCLLTSFCVYRYSYLKRV